MFINHYLCPDCGTAWTDTWSCTCDDTCPACGCRDVSPVESDDGDDPETDSPQSDLELFDQSGYTNNRIDLLTRL